MSKKRNKTYNPHKFVQVHSHYNEDYIVFAIDSMALGVLNKKGNPVSINANTHTILQNSICERNACYGVLYKENGETEIKLEEATISRCTGSEAVVYINEKTKLTCDEVGLPDVLGRFYFITGDMNWEWTDAFIYGALEQAGSFELLVTQREYMKLELEDMEDYMKKYDPKKSQVGGTHYSHLAIQPAEIIKGLRLGWNLGNAYKYISRFPYKGKEQDLAKAYDYIQRELHDGYENFHRVKVRVESTKTAQYRAQFKDQKQQVILMKIENAVRKIWAYDNKEMEELWGATLFEILYLINQLSKEKYNVETFGNR